MQSASMATTLLKSVLTLEAGGDRDQDQEEARRLKAFLQKLEIPTTLAEMDIPLDRIYLQQVLSATAAGPDMVHIPYPVSEDMLFEAMSVIEHL